MSTSVKLAWVAVAFALLIGVARADEVGGARFAVPDGWVASDHDGARVVVPSSLASGEVMMALVLGVQPMSGTPASKIDELARSLNADAKVISTSAVASAPYGAAGTLHFKTFDVEAKDLGKHTRMVAILVRGKQAAIVVALISSEATLAKHAAGLQALLASLEVGGTSPATAPAAPAATTTTTSAIPTGDTPDKYPGSSGFRPSGRGVPVPAARVVDGRPQGLWWYPHTGAGKILAQRVIYLADGTCATAPRPGGPWLFDLEGQRRLGGVGTCSVKKGTFSRTIDGHTQGGAFKAGRDKEGAYMNIGEMRHRPLSPVDAKVLVGTWKTSGNTYTFRADGTYVSGSVTDTSAVGQGGSWAVEGYTLFMRPSGGDGWVSTIGATGTYVVIDSAVYQRAR